VDLRLSSATPSAHERAAVDAALDGLLGAQYDDHFVDAGHLARGRRHLLLPALHAVSDAVGWISEGALNHVARRLCVPPADAYRGGHVLCHVLNRAAAAAGRARL